jgi:uncharacterized membrane protein YfhO
MQNKIFYRILIDLLLILSVIHGWWFVAVPLMLIGAFYFSYFIEGIVAGIAYDSLFGFIPEMGWYQYIGTILSVIIVGGVAGMKKVLRE